MILAVPLALVTQNRLDGLWNEEFKRMLRSAILGQNSEKEPSFEWTVRKLIDCCAYKSTRINGDAALTGYCYAGRKVFCVQYYDTKIKC